MHYIHIHIGCFHAFPCIARIKRHQASGRSAEDPPCPEDDFGRPGQGHHGWEIPVRTYGRHMGKITMKWGEFMRTYGKLWEKAWKKNIDKWRFWWAFPAFPLCNGHFNGKLITLNWEFFSMPCLITKKVSEIWISQYLRDHFCWD